MNHIVLKKNASSLGDITFIKIMLKYVASKRITKQNSFRYLTSTAPSSTHKLPAESQVGVQVLLCLVTTSPSCQRLPMWLKSPPNVRSTTRNLRKKDMANGWNCDGASNAHLAFWFPCPNCWQVPYFLSTNQIKAIFVQTLSWHCKKYCPGTGPTFAPAFFRWNMFKPSMLRLEKKHTPDTPNHYNDQTPKFLRIHQGSCWVP